MGRASAIAGLAMTALGAWLGACGDEAEPLPARALVYSRTLGYRHADAIDAALPVLPLRLAEFGIATDATEDPAQLTADSLVTYGCVVFLYTSGNDILDESGKTALEAFVRGGGGWVGLHSAADTEYEWPFYQQLVVQPFASHPAIQEATVIVEDHMHPAMAAVPDGPWIATDEWYDFPASARATPGVTVLATLDESSYTGGLLGADHPIIWAHENLGGRALYSGLGHVATRWADPVFVDHVASAIAWTCGR